MNPREILNSGAPREINRNELIVPAIEFIDEHCNLNPYGEFGNGRGIDGFEAPTKKDNIRTIGRKEAQLFKLKDKGEVLEIGWGGNGLFAEGIYDETRVPISIVDADNFEGLSRNLPPQNALDDGNFHLYKGQAKDLGDNPYLEGKKFGSIIFHGSLFGSGSNMTIQQRMEMEGIKAGGAKSDIPHQADQEISAVLEGAKKHLSPDGVLAVVSDRFSLYSPGRSANEIPLEKLEFLNVISKASSLGAKRISIVGVSIDEIRSNFMHKLDNQTIDALTNGVLALPDQTSSSYLDPEQIKRIKDSCGKIIPSNVGIIDAVAISF